MNIRSIYISLKSVNSEIGNKSSLTRIWPFERDSGEKFNMNLKHLDLKGK